MARRQYTCKVNPNDIGLPESSSLAKAFVFEYLTPKIQKLLADAKKLKGQHNYGFCWTKNSRVYLRKTEDSRPILIKSQNDLDVLTQRESRT